MNLSGNLKKIREEFGYSLREVEEKTGIHNIYRYESGAIVPAVETLIKFSEFYKVSLDALVGNGTNFSQDMYEPAREAHYRNLLSYIGIPESEIPQDYKGIVEYNIAELPSRENYVIKKRFFCGETLKEVGEELGISRERVRQIEAKALREIKRGIVKWK